MALPTQTEVEIPLLRVLENLGGEAEPKDVYGPVASFFPQLTPEDLSARMDSGQRIHLVIGVVERSRGTLDNCAGVSPRRRSRIALSPVVIPLAADFHPKGVRTTSGRCALAEARRSTCDARAGLLDWSS